MISLLGPRMLTTTVGQNDRASDLVNATRLQRMSPLFG